MTAGPAPDELLGRLVGGARIAQVIYALAELGIGGLLADGPRDAAALAEAAGCHPEALRRLLRAAASAGVFAETGSGCFALTPMAALLQPGVPDSQLAMVRHHGQTIFPAYTRIVLAARTGAPVFADVFGMPFYPYLNAHPAASELVYDEADRRDWDIAMRCMDGVDLTQFGVIADIGGGTGSFLAHLLLRAPQARGVLYDRPEARPASAAALDLLGVSGRVEVVGGDFFTDPLPVADLYTLKNTVHSLDDQDAVRLLGRIAAAMADSPGARLLICDRVVAPGNTPDHTKFLDIDMLLLHGGRERNAAEWHDLTAAAGLRLVGSGGILLCGRADLARPLSATSAATGVTGQPDVSGQ